MHKWSNKNPLTIRERKIIQKGIENKLTSLEIAEQLGRGKTTITREAKRLGSIDDYDAEEAQKDFEKKQFEGRKKISITQKLRYKKI